MATELIAFDIDCRGGKVYDGEGCFYSKQDVDKVLAEKEQAIAELQQKLEAEREYGLNRAKGADKDIGLLGTENCALTRQNRNLKVALLRKTAAWANMKYNGRSSESHWLHTQELCLDLADTIGR